MRTLILAIACAWLCLPASAQASIDDWAGVYKFTHQIGISGDTEVQPVENILEIVPVSPTHAYVRTMIFGYNVDRCKFFGVAQIEGSKLVYRGSMQQFGFSTPDPSPPPNRLTTTLQDRCELTIARTSDETGAPVIQLSDRDNLCKRAICGSRAYFNTTSWPVASRRTIRYMDRLKASTEYAAAVEEAGLSPKP